MPFDFYTTKPVAIQFGAGNIGRGFIGAVLANAGFHVIFADVQQKLVDALNRERQYNVHILNSEIHVDTISDVSGVFSTDLPAIEQIAKQPLSIITTAVGPSVLPKLAKPIAQIIRTRMATNRGPINIVACENLQEATNMLREEIEKELIHEGELQYMHENIGFAVCSVDRIVPPFSSDNVLDVGVEPFFEWNVDAKSLKKTDPDVIIRGMRTTDHLGAYVQRKLFTLNTGHAMTAYLGFIASKDTILDSISDDTIYNTVSRALHESGAALISAHEPLFTKEEHEKYVKTILKRFANPNLRDEVGRVGREPLRKLKRGDRLLGPIEMCRERGLERGTLLVGVAAALLFDPKGKLEDKEAQEVQVRIKEDGLESFVRHLTGWEEGDEDLKKVVEEYERLKGEMTAVPRPAL